jgi:hypothetical protein
MITTQCIISKQSRDIDFAPGGSITIHFIGPDASRSKLPLMFGLKRCILHPVGTCVLTHLFFPMGGPPPHSGEQQQLIWTHLPQGFKISPTIFGTVLTSDLQVYLAE